MLVRFFTYSARYKIAQNMFLFYKKFVSFSLSLHIWSLKKEVWHQSILIPVCLRERERERQNESNLFSPIYTGYILSLSLSDVAAAEAFLHSFSLVLDRQQQYIYI